MTMKAELELLSLDLIDDHPLNPRLIYRDDVIDAIVANLNGQWPQQHALHVRPVKDRYELIAGHQRKRAALKAEIKKVWCWVQRVSDADAYMMLATSNAQGELSPLEIGIHAFRCQELEKGGRGKKGGLSEYADRLGKTQGYISQVRQAAEVLEVAKPISQLMSFSDKAQHLCSLHKLPKTLWKAGCEWIASAPSVTVSDAEQRFSQVAYFIKEPPIEERWQREYLPPVACAESIITGTDPGNFRRLSEIASKVYNQFSEDGPQRLAVVWERWLIENTGKDSWDIKKVQGKRLELEDEAYRSSETGDKVQVLLADPPWQYEFAETDNRQIENKYPTGTVEEIKEHLNAKWAPALADDCVLFLWATAPKLQEAIAIMEAWGFDYKTNAVWDKEKIGMGYWFRGQHELLLVGTKGQFSPPDQDKRISSVFREARGKHSAKPECVYEALESMFPESVKGEMYQRKPREGWIGFGNEA